MRLLTAGSAVVGRTEIGDAVWLKLTLLNPHATNADVDALLDLVVRAGLAEHQAPTAEQRTGGPWPGGATITITRPRTTDTPEDVTL